MEKVCHDNVYYTQGHDTVQKLEWCTLAAGLQRHTTSKGKTSLEPRLSILDFVLQLERKIGKKIFQSCETKSRAEKLHTTRRN